MEPLMALKTRLTMLLLLVLTIGRVEPFSWFHFPIVEEASNMMPCFKEPQLFLINAVPSPSMIARWSVHISLECVVRLKEL